MVVTAEGQPAVPALCCRPPHSKEACRTRGLLGVLGAAAALLQLARGLEPGLPCCCPTGEEAVCTLPWGPGPSRTPSTLVLWPLSAKPTVLWTVLSRRDRQLCSSVACLNTSGSRAEGLRTHGRPDQTMGPRPHPVSGGEIQGREGHPPFTLESAPLSLRHRKVTQERVIEDESKCSGHTQSSSCLSPQPSPRHPMAQHLPG